MGSFSEFNTKNIYVDSNILMEDGSEKLINELIHYQLTIKIPKVQYDEIYNLTKSDNEKKSFKARNALRNIEKLLDADILNFNDININKKDKTAYADPEFIKIIFNDLKKGEKVVFITNDRDLRIRIKLKLKENSDLTNDLSLYSLDELEYSQVSKSKLEYLEDEDFRSINQKKFNYMHYCPNCEENVIPIKHKKDFTKKGHNELVGSTYLVEECFTCGYIFKKKWLEDYNRGFGGTDFTGMSGSWF